MKDSWESIARTAMLQLVKAAAELDEAERLLRAGHAGTDKWVQEVSAWKLRKDAIVDCSRAN